MQRHLTTPTETTFRSPKPSKTFERQFASAMKRMVEQIGERFENVALKGLNKGTVDKFEDAQIGNYANIYLKLSKQAQRKLIKQFSDDRIDDFVGQILNRQDKANSATLYSRVESKVGIDSKELLATEALSPDFNALVAESSQWAKKLRDDAMEFFTANSLRLMTQGTSFEEILNNHGVEVKKQKNHAQFLARNQIQNFNSMASKIRAQNLGVTEAIWITARDERVRPCHQKRDGKKFDLDKGLHSSCDDKTLFPGVDFNCRCTYEMIIPGD